MTLIFGNLEWREYNIWLNSERVISKISEKLGVWIIFLKTGWGLGLLRS